MGQGDYVVLGLMASQQVVGLYYFGFRFAIQPLTLIVANLTSVLYPALAHYRAEPQRQGQAAFAAVKLLLYCMMPAGIMQAAVADPLIHTVFASRWWPSIPIVQILSVALAIDSAAWLAEALMNARGEFRSLCMYAAVETPLFFLLTCIGASVDSAVGVAWGVCFFYLSKPIFVYLAFKTTGVSSRQVIAAYILPLGMALATIGSGWLLTKLPFFDRHLLLQMSMIIFFGLVTYTASLKLLAPSIWAEFEQRIWHPIRMRI